MGVEGSVTWSLLLDAAERLMRENGYAAVTSRQLGKEAGLHISRPGDDRG